MKQQNHWWRHPRLQKDQPYHLVSVIAQWCTTTYCMFSTEHAYALQCMNYLLCGHNYNSIIIYIYIVYLHSSFPNGEDNLQYHWSSSDWDFPSSDLHRRVDDGCAKISGHSGDMDWTKWVISHIWSSDKDLITIHKWSWVGFHWLNTSRRVHLHYQHWEWDQSFG